MTEFTKEKLDSVLAKVRAALAIADDERAPEGEREAARLRAEALMFKYRIEEATSVASGYSDNDRLVPVWRTMVLTKASSEFAEYYRMIAGAVSYHVGAKSVTRWDNGEIVAEFCGYRSDLEFGDLLMTAAMMEFGKRLEPSYDPNKSDAENIYVLRMAGMERKRIARLVYGEWTTENEMKAKNRKVTNVFKKECIRRGEDPDVLLGRGNNVKTYRRSYADGFVEQFGTRLWRMRTSHGEESGALVLASREEAVEEAFYERYPQFRPRPVDPNAPAPKIRMRKAKERSVNWQARERGRDAALAVDLGRNATGTGRMRPSETRKGIE